MSKPDWVPVGIYVHVHAVGPLSGFHAGPFAELDVLPPKRLIALGRKAIEAPEPRRLRPASEGIVSMAHRSAGCQV